MNLGWLTSLIIVLCSIDYSLANLDGICRRPLVEKEPCHNGTKTIKITTFVKENGHCVPVLSTTNVHCESKKKNLCRCSVVGDPHYRTYDGQAIHFYGDCKYTLTKYQRYQHPCNFNIEVQNEHRGGNKYFTYTKHVIIHMFGDTFVLDKHNKFKVNGVSHQVPYEKGVDARVFQSHKYLQFVAPRCSVRVAFDGDSNAFVEVSKQYGDHMRGICGNCNGLQDDFKTESREDVSHEKYKYCLIGDSYSVSTIDHKCKPAPHVSYEDVCGKDWIETMKAQKFCGGILATNNPFKECAKHGHVDLRNFYEDCLIDMCVNKENPHRLKKVRCEILSGLAEVCSEAGFEGVKWRTAFKCTVKCGKNQHFNSKASPCPRTCENHFYGTKDPCYDLPEREGCECNKGHIRDGALCVKPMHCKCINLCVDRENVNKCQKWKGEGQCKKFPEQMNVFCSRTCGFCTPKALLCEDELSTKKCLHFRNQGLCFHEFYRTICGLTCNYDKCSCGKDKSIVGDCDEMTNYQTTTHYRFVRDSQGRCAKVISQTNTPCKCHERLRHVGPCNHCIGKSNVTIYIKEVIGDKCIKRKEHHFEDCKRCPENTHRTRECIDDHLVKITISFNRLNGCFHCVADQRVKSRKIQCKNHKIVKKDEKTCLKHTKYITRRAVNCKCHASIRTKITVYRCNKKPVVWKPFCSHGKIIHRTVIYKFHKHGFVPEYKDRIEIIKCQSSRTKVPGHCKREVHGYFYCKATDVELISELGPNCKCVIRKRKQLRICCCKEPEHYETCNRQLGVTRTVNISYHLVTSKYLSYCKKDAKESSVTVECQEEYKTIKGKCQKNCIRKDKLIRIYRDGCQVKTEFVRDNFHICCCSPSNWTNTKCEGESIVTNIFHRKIECDKCVDVLFSSHRQSVHCPEKVVTKSKCIYPKHKRKITTVSFKLEDCKCERIVHSEYEKCPPDCDYKVLGTNFGKCNHQTCQRPTYTFFQNEDCDNGTKTCFETCCCPFPNITHSYCDQTTGIGYTRIKWWDFDEHTKLCTSRSKKIASRVSCDKHRKINGKCDEHKKDYRKIITIKHVLDHPTCKCRKVRLVTWKRCRCPPKHVIKRQCRDGLIHIAEVFYYLNKRKTDCIAVEKTRVKEVFCYINVVVGRTESITRCKYKLYYKRHFKENCKCKSLEYFRIYFLSCCDKPTRREVKCLKNHSRVVLTTTFHVSRGGKRCLPLVHKRIDVITCRRYKVVVEKPRRHCRSWIITKYYQVVNCKCVQVKVTKEKKMRCCIPSFIITKECKENEIRTITAKMNLIGGRCIPSLGTTKISINCPHPIDIQGHCNHVTGLRSVTRKFYVVHKCKCHRRIAHYTVDCPCRQKDRKIIGHCDSRCKRTIKILRYKRIGRRCSWSLIKSFWEHCCCPNNRSITDCVNDRAYRTTTTKYHRALIYKETLLHRCIKTVNVTYKLVECYKGYTERQCIHHRIYETRCAYRKLKCKCQKRCKMFITGPCRCKELNHCKHKCIHNTKYSVCYKYKRGRRVCEKCRHEYPIHETCPKPVTECKSCCIHKKHGLYRSCRTTYFDYRDCRCIEKRKYKLRLCRCDDDINSRPRCNRNRFVITTTSFFRKGNKCIPWKTQHYRSFVCMVPVISVREHKCSTVYTLIYYIKSKCRCFKRTIVRKNSKCCGHDQIVRQCQKDHWLFIRYNLKRRSSGMSLFREVRSKIMKTFCQVIKLSWVQHISCRKDFKTISCNVRTNRLTTENHHFAIVSCACKHITSRTFTKCLICPKDIIIRSPCGQRDGTGRAYLEVTIKTWKIHRNNKCKLFIKHRKDVCKCPKPRHFKICQSGKQIFTAIWYDIRSRPPCRPVVKIRTELVHCYNNGHKNKWIHVGWKRCFRPGQFSYKYYARPVFNSKTCSCFYVKKSIRAGICCKPCTFRRQCKRNEIVNTTICHVPKHLKCKDVKIIIKRPIVCPPSRRELIGDCKCKVISYRFIFYKAKKCRCLRSTKIITIEKPGDKKECVKNAWRITHIDFELRHGHCFPKPPTIIFKHIVCPFFIRLVDKQINDCKFRRSYYTLRPKHCKCVKHLIRSEILNYRCCKKDVVGKTCFHNNIIVTTRIHYHLLDFRCHMVRTVRRRMKSCRAIPPKHVRTGKCTYKIIHYTPVLRNCKCHRRVSFVEKKENCCYHKKPHTTHECDAKTGRKITIYTTYHHTKEDTCVKHRKVLSKPVHCHRMRCEKTSTQCIHNTKTVKMFCFVRKGCRCVRKKVKQSKQCCGSVFDWNKKGLCDKHKRYFYRIQYFAMKLNPATKLCNAIVVKVQYIRCRCPRPYRRESCLKNIYKIAINISYVLSGHSCILVRHEKIDLISRCSRKHTVKLSEICNKKTGWSRIVYETSYPENCKCRRKRFERKKICICQVAFPNHATKKYCKDDHIIVEETMKAHCTETRVDWRTCIKTIPILGCNKKYIEKGDCFRARNGYATHIRYDTHVQYFLKNCICERKVVRKVIKHCACRKFHQTKRCIQSTKTVTSYSYFVFHGICRQARFIAKYPIKCPHQPIITKSKCQRNWYVITKQKFFINHCRCVSRVSHKRCHCSCPKDSKYKRCSKHYYINVITIKYHMEHCQCMKKVCVEEHNPVCPRFKRITKGPCIPGKIASYREIIIKHRKRRFHTCKCSIVERRKRKICACSKFSIVRNYCQNNSIVTERWIWKINRKLNKCVKVLKFLSFKHIVCPAKASRKFCNQATGEEKEITVRYRLKHCKCIKAISVRRYRCKCDTKVVRIKKGECSKPTCKRVDTYRHEELRGEICLPIKTRKVKVCCCPKNQTREICKVNDIVTTTVFYVLKHGCCERKETELHKLIKCPSVIIKKVGNCRKDGYKKIIFYQDRPSHCKCIRVKIKEKQCRCRCPRNNIQNKCHQSGHFIEKIITKHRLLFCKCETRRTVEKQHICCPRHTKIRSLCLWKYGKNYAIITTTNTRHSLNRHCKCKAHVRITTKICRCKKNKRVKVSCHPRRHLVVVTKAFTILRGGKCIRMVIKKIRRVRCNNHWKLKGESSCMPHGFYGIKTLTYTKQVHQKCQCKETTQVRVCHCSCSGPLSSTVCVRNQNHHYEYYYKIINCKCKRFVKSDRISMIYCKTRRPVFGKCGIEKNRCVRHVVYYKVYTANCKCHIRHVIKRIGCRTCKCDGYTRRKCDRRSNKIITKTTRCHVAFNGWLIWNSEITKQQISCVAIKICKQLTKCHRKSGTQTFSCVVPYVHNCHCSNRYVKTTYPCKCKPCVKKIGKCNRKTCIRKIAYIKSHLIILKNEIKKCVDKIKIFKQICCCLKKPTQSFSCFNNHWILTVNTYVFNNNTKSCIHVCNKYDKTPICQPTKQIIPGVCNRSTCKISKRSIHKRLVDCVCRTTSSVKVTSCSCCLKKNYTKMKCVGKTKWIINHRFEFKEGKCREIVGRTKFPINCPVQKIEFLRCNLITRMMIIRTHLSVLKNCHCHRKIIDKEVCCRCPENTFKRKCDKAHGVIRNIYISYRFDQVNYQCIKSTREENHQIKCSKKKKTECSRCNIDHHNGQYKICTTTWERRLDCSCKGHSKWQYTLCKCDKSRSHTKCINNLFVTTITYFVKEKTKNSLYNSICVKKQKVMRHIGPRIMCIAPHVIFGPCIKNYRIYIVKSNIRKYCTCIPTTKVYRVRCRCPAKKEISRQCIDDTKIRKVIRTYKLVCHKGFIPKCRCVWMDNIVDVDVRCPDDVFKQGCVNKKNVRTWTTYDIQNCACVSNTETDSHADCTVTTCTDLLPKYQCGRIRKLGKCDHSNVYFQFLCPVSCGYCEKCKLPAIEKYLTDCRCRTKAGKKICSRKVVIIEYVLRNRKCHPIRRNAESICDCSTEVTKLALCETNFKAGTCSKPEIRQICPYHCNPKCRHCEGERVYKICVQDGTNKGRFEVLRIKFFKIHGACVFEKTVTFEGHCPVCDRSEIKVVQDCFEGKRVVITKYVDRLPDGACVNREKKHTYSCEGCCTETDIKVGSCYSHGRSMSTVFWYNSRGFCQLERVTNNYSCNPRCAGIREVRTNCLYNKQLVIKTWYSDLMCIPHSYHEIMDCNAP